MPELALIVFFLSLVTFVVIGLDVRRYVLHDKPMSQPLLYVSAIVGSFGTLMGLILWPVAAEGRKVCRPVMPIVVSAVVTVAIAVIPLVA